MQPARPIDTPSRPDFAPDFTVAIQRAQRPSALVCAAADRRMTLLCYPTFGGKKLIVSIPGDPRWDGARGEPLNDAQVASLQQAIAAAVTARGFEPIFAPR
ncbi:hypothetical protein [Roseiterribacter gracilis]|uniref:Uncharacterized protein n=1 Tax=Roseiterribacter gracilis TaxID=2812848 RepID=A0A8S8X9H1_9PROT|nr:hypothetical protein TMPK1_16510 [Rhodospirillales bacterium TMPK1]